MRNEIGIIGDVHGQADRLSALLPAVADACSTLVFVGDYVNRGPLSREVLEALCELASARPRSVFLAGNHDLAMAAALEDGLFDEFLQVGGAATVISYVPEPRGDVARQFRDAVPRAHREFLAALLPTFHRDGLVVSHEPLSSLEPGVRNVHGHRPTRDSNPVIGHQYIALDTGCGTIPGRPLTCLYWPSLAWQQA